MLVVEQILRYIVFLTVNNCVGSTAQNLIDELVAEGLTDVGGGPEQAEWDTTLKDSVGAWTDTGTGGDEDRAAEHGSNPEHTIGRHTMNPELGGVAKACHSLRGG